MNEALICLHFYTHTHTQTPIQAMKLCLCMCVCALHAYNKESLHTLHPLCIYVRQLLHPPTHTIKYNYYINIS